MATYTFKQLASEKEQELKTLREQHTEALEDVVTGQLCSTIDNL